MPINVDSNGKWPGPVDNGGSFSFESLGNTGASIWPAIGGSTYPAQQKPPFNMQQNGDHLEDIRKHLDRLLRPVAGEDVYINPEDEPDFDVQDGIDNYADNVLLDPDFPDKIGMSFARNIFWKGHKWICAYGDISDADEYINPNSTDYGINNYHLYSEDGVNGWISHKPPEALNPSIDVWVTNNSFWRLAPEDDFYHERDKHSPTYDATLSSKEAGSFLYLAHAKEELPEQVDRRLTNDGVGNNSTGGKGKNRSTFDATDYRDLTENDITRFTDSKKEFLRRQLTQIESLGTSHAETWDHKDQVDLEDVNQYSFLQPEASGLFPTHDPMAPKKDDDRDPPSAIAQFLFEPKVCGAYQNSMVRIIENMAGAIYLPVDEDYQNNRAEYDQWAALVATPIFDEVGPPYDSYQGLGTFSAGGNSVVRRMDGGVWHLYRCIAPGEIYIPAGTWVPADWILADIVWDENKYEFHTKFAPIDDPWWGCNDSGIECLLKYIDEYDWWFDTKYPHVPQHIAQAQHFNMDPYDSGTTRWNQHKEPSTSTTNWVPDYTEDERNTGFPKPIGTWRRVFRYTFGRIDMREVCDWDGTDDDTIALTKTLMRPKSYGNPIQNIGCEWKPLEPLSIHYYEYFGNVPIVEEIPATFGVSDFPMPWPGWWDSNGKHELFFGHNWDGVLTRPHHLPYFDSNGETYDQYDPEPDDDGRPVFDMLESLRDIPSPSPEQQELLDFMDELALRHDPSLIDQGTKVYEIFADMLNDMRTILMNCLLRHYGVITHEEKIYWQTGNFGEALDEAAAIAKWEDWVDDLEIPVFPPNDDEPPDPNWSDTTNLDFQWLWRTDTGSFPKDVGGSTTRKAFRYIGLDELGPALVSNIYVLLKFNWAGTAIDKRDAVFSINDALTQTTIPWDYTYSLNGQPDSTYWVDVGGIDLTQTSPWLSITFHLDKDDVPDWYPAFVNFLGSKIEGDVAIEGDVLFYYDWDLIDDTVFGTPNVKGLRQAP